MTKRYVAEDPATGEVVDEEVVEQPVYSEPVVRSAPATEYVERDVVASPQAEVYGMFSTLSALVALAGIAVLSLLGLRLGFLMSEANPSAGFVDWVYDITGPLVHPFQGITHNRILDSGGIFEPATAIAMGIYLVAAMFVVMLLWALAPRWLGSREEVVRNRVAHQH